ncbi:hypothetical protein, conserved [Angomonas deanei]|uniref:Uncharacterized protein n=1 Tax=Angomonas deanei TaxID=59799 RepID=A0A7G2CIS5_9TRYP|nr:hypothetical protein, conserved [Angomonas deanei]
MSNKIKVFLAPLEKMSYLKREKFMLELGSKIGTTANYVIPEINEKGWDITEELACSADPYDRLMASFALRGCISGKGEVAVDVGRIRELSDALVRDSSRPVAMLNVDPVVRLSGQETLSKIATEIQMDRLTIFCQCVLTKRADGQAIVDELYSGPMTANRRALLTPFVSEKVVNQSTDDDILNTPPALLGKMAQRHPFWVSSRLAKMTAKTPQGALHHGRLGTALITVMVALVKSGNREKREVGFRLLEAELLRAADRSDTLNDVLGRYVQYLTVETAEYVVRHKEEYKGRVSFTFTTGGWKKMVKRMDLVTELIRMEAIPDVFHLPSAVPAEVRRVVYKSYRDRLVNQDGSIQVETLGQIPDEADRHREVRRIWEITEIKEDPTRRIPYLAVMPPVEAREKAKEYVHSQKEHERAMATAALATNVHYHADALDSFLNFCLESSNAADTGRRGALAGLASLQLNRWKEQHLPVVEKVVKAALGSADASSATLQSLAELTVRLTVRFPKDGFSMVKQVFTANASLGYKNLPHAPFEVKKQILMGLIPIFEARARADEADKVKAAFFSFGKPFAEKAVAFPEVALLLHTLLYSIDNQSSPRAAIALYTKLFPSAGYMPVLEELLRRDPDAINVDPIPDIVSRRIGGEILSTYLVPFHHTGRFAGESEVKRIFSFPRQYYYCWTGDQQRTYAKSSLLFVEQEKNSGVWELRSALERISFLPSITIDDGLRPYAQLDQEEYLYRSVVGFLANMTDEGSLEELQKAVLDERGAEAIKALRLRVVNMTPERTVSTLQPALGVKSVSIQKEALRILGSSASECAFNALVQFDREKGDNMHRDVRIAYMRAMWNYLERKEVWDDFDKAVATGRSAVFRAICQIPDEQLTKQWQLEKYQTLLMNMLRVDEPDIQGTALDRIATFKGRTEKVSDELGDLCFGFLESGHGSLDYKALNLLASYNEIDVDATARKLFAVKNDRSLRQIVGTLTQIIGGASNLKRPTLVSVANRLRELLQAQGRQSRLALDLLFLNEPSQWVALLEDFVKGGNLHPGCYDINVDSFLYLHNDHEQLTAVERACRHHKESFIQMLGLRITCALGPMYGFDREALLAYQQMESNAWVRDAALLVELPEEDTNDGADDEADEEWGADDEE